MRSLIWFTFYKLSKGSISRLRSLLVWRWNHSMTDLLQVFAFMFALSGSRRWSCCIWEPSPGSPFLSSMQENWCPIGALQHWKPKASVCAGWATVLQGAFSLRDGCEKDPTCRLITCLLELFIKKSNIQCFWKLAICFHGIFSLGVAECWHYCILHFFR